MILQTTVSTNKITYEEKLCKAEALLRQADKLVIGIGAGLSEAGTDTLLFKLRYPHYHEIGFRSIDDLRQHFWFLQKKRPESYWGFWAQHLFNILHADPIARPYQDLLDIAKDKDYFIMTTNIDNQLERAGFSEDKILAIKGDCRYSRCAAHCSEDLYPNKSAIEAMLKNMPASYEVRSEDIPLCPRCGAMLIPNIRIDEQFVETQYLSKRAAYKDFISQAGDHNIVFLELGVDFNTPLAIRNPFEVLTCEMPNASLIRINDTFAKVPSVIKHKAVWIQDDISKVLSDLKAGCPAGE